VHPSLLLLLTCPPLLINNTGVYVVPFSRKKKREIKTGMN